PPRAPFRGRARCAPLAIAAGRCAGHVRRGSGRRPRHDRPLQTWCTADTSERSRCSTHAHRLRRARRRSLPRRKATRLPNIEASMAQQASVAQQGATATPSRPATGAGARSGVQMDPNGDLAPWQASATDPWDRRKAAHLIRRAGFGAKIEEIDAIVAIGMNRMGDILLSPAPVGLREYGTVVLPNGEVLNLTYNLQARRAYWLWEAVHGFYPLREKMALFWHD